MRTKEIGSTDIHNVDVYIIAYFASYDHYKTFFEVKKSGG